MPRERELKLEANAAALRQIRQWLRSHGAKAHTARITESRYFNSADYALQKSGISMRIRSDGRRSIQTIKSSEHKSAGFFDRAEWETPVQGFIPDFAAAIDTGLNAFREHGFCRSLQPIFSVEARRAAFDLPGKSGIVLMIDRGTVFADEHRDEFCEIEIETPDGRLDELFRMARHLVRVAPLRLGTTTKSGRGYKLLHHEDGVVHAGKPALPPDICSEDAFCIIARDCLHQLAANLPATVEDVPEGLHQMRVGLRRLRACMSLFSELVECRETARIKRGLKWLGQSLGRVRDIDVLLERGLPPELSRRLEAERRRARKAATSALGSARSSRLMLDTLAWIECGPWMKNAKKLARARREQPVAKHASQELARRYARLVKIARHLRKLDEEERHKLRIRAKKLRYGVEFFTAVFGGDSNVHRARRMLSALRELQNSLGELNDISVRHRLLLQVAGKETLPAIDTILARDDEFRAEFLARAISAAGKISATKAFWK